MNKSVSLNPLILLPTFWAVLDNESLDS